MLIAEDLLLLLTADDTGKLAARGTNTNMALGGALLAELALMERVDIAGPDERVKEGRLVVRDAGPTGDSMLDEALATVGHKEGKKPQNVVAALGKRTRRAALRASCRGRTAARRGGPDPRHLPDPPLARGAPGHEAAVRAGLVTALRQGGPRTPGLERSSPSCSR